MNMVHLVRMVYPPARDAAGAVQVRDDGHGAVGRPFQPKHDDIGAAIKVLRTRPDPARLFHALEEGKSGSCYREAEKVGGQARVDPKHRQWATKRPGRPIAARVRQRSR